MHRQTTRGLAAPVFYLRAGPNGAGKSTLYRSAVNERLIPATAEFINADLHEAAQLQQVVDPVERSRQARLWADARRSQCLTEGRSFASETVFSHTSKLDLISAAQRAGFAVALLYDTSVPADGHFQPPRLVARLRGGELRWQAETLPAWAQRVLAPEPMR